MFTAIFLAIACAFLSGMTLGEVKRHGLRPSLGKVLFTVVFVVCVALAVGFLG